MPLTPESEGVPASRYPVHCEQYSCADFRGWRVSDQDNEQTENKWDDWRKKGLEPYQVQITAG